MKRVAWLLLLAFLSFNSVGFTEASSSTRSISSTTSNAPLMLQPPTMALSIPGKNAVCTNVGATRICASVSPARVAPHTYLTVYGMQKIRGVGQAGQIMTATWRSKGTASCSAVTDASGMASCTAYFSGGTKGHPVRVKVTIGKYNLTAHFTSK